MHPTRRQALCFAAYAASRAADAGPATDLRSSLDEIEAWLKAHAPHLARSLRPGLTRAQMQPLIGNRQIVLPEEAIALFERWDGMADRNSFFFDRQFLSLKEALEYHDIIANVDNQWGAYRFAWLPLFQIQYTRGAYAILCGPHAGPVPTAPVDDVGDGPDSPAAGSLTEFLQFVAAQFRRGAYFAGKYGQLELDGKRSLRPYGSVRPDRDSCVEMFATHPGGDLPQVVMRVATQSQDRRIARIVYDQLRSGSGPAWRDPLLLESFIQCLAMSCDPSNGLSPANILMVELCRNSNLVCRWLAMMSVGHSQYMKQYHVPRPIADFLCQELITAGRPPGYLHNVILTLGKAHDQRAVPHLLAVIRSGEVNNAHVARLCLDAMGEPGSQEFNRRFR
jgi:hypothetical protein